MYSGSYRVEKKCLGNYLKSAFSQYPWKSNMVKALKHISNYNDGTFIILTADLKGYSVLKSHY